MTIYILKRLFFSIVLLCVITITHVSANNENQRLLSLVSKWFEAAREDDPDALFNLGQYYRQGIGIPPDINEAILFYTRAAELGHTGAQLNLGSLYYFHVVNAPNVDQAMYFWQLAADAHHRDAQYLLAILLFKHTNDESSAIHRLKQAADQGHSEAIALLSQNDVFTSDETDISEISIPVAEKNIRYAVQLGAFSSLEAAQRLGDSLAVEFVTKLEINQQDIHILQSHSSQGAMLYRYVVGDFSSRGDAVDLCNLIKQLQRDCLVVAL